MTWDIREGDSIELLRAMPGESVHCCVTSPPYWGLRDYGVEGQIGLEGSVDEHIERMVDLFREVRRVLRADGTLWLNYGDAYAGSCQTGGTSRRSLEGFGNFPDPGGAASHTRRNLRGIKAKDMIGLPWMLAFALRADGWWLRSEIIWSKPNPMPESVTDRPTKAHEQVFLLAKSPRYFYDAEAVREGTTGNAKPRRRDGAPTPKQQANGDHREAGFGMSGNKPVSTRNARTVWSIQPQPFPEAHFATFPEELPARCIKAGSSAKGCCPKCGAPWKRVVETGEPDAEQRRACGADSGGGYAGTDRKDYSAARAQSPAAVKARILAGMRERRTAGWEPTCECGRIQGTETTSYAPVPCTVLDPFAGAGTTLLVAERLGRDSIGCELNPEYARIARERITAADPMATVEVLPGKVQRSLFAEESA